MLRPMMTCQGRMARTKSMVADQAVEVSALNNYREHFVYREDSPTKKVKCK
jgi:hypothetical protein